MVVDKNEIEARQGENSGRMPYVLGLSILLILISFGAIYAYDEAEAPKQDVHSTSNAASK